jgi:hypothetical protein
MDRLNALTLAVAVASLLAVVAVSIYLQRGDSGDSGDSGETAPSFSERFEGR